ncbi:MAG: ribbon-helix-helix protein, CopG family [Acidobacteriaceae bacterium]|nr:ribbon-helix-helix protein, CopG family [Acidobacteriaceae bacterium]
MPTESRSKTISFRLSVEEYERFRNLCFVHGTRSVSEMARAAINLLLQEPNCAPQMALSSRVAELEARLQLLSSEIKRINQKKASTRAQSTNSAPI